MAAAKMSTKTAWLITAALRQTTIPAITTVPFA
jgi:hypothetical protein